MTLIMFFCILFFGLAGLANAGMDSIKFKPKTFLFQSDWWLSRGEYLPAKRTWLTRYLLFFLADGWHFLKLVMVASLVLACTSAAFDQSTKSFWYVITYVSGLYAAFSVAHLGGYYWFWEQK